MIETDPYKLFDIDAMEYKVMTSKGEVRYVNLDNAATTIPFVEVI